MKPWIQKYRTSMLISTLLVAFGAVVFMIVAHPPVHVKSGPAVAIAILIHIVGISLEIIVVASVINLCTNRFKVSSTPSPENEKTKSSR